MCGLGGYVGIKDRGTRLALTYGLGFGIDRRGGDASGYVSTGDSYGSSVTVHRKVGRWRDANTKFFRRAAAGTTLVMHARFATCGKKDTTSNAHPFTIKRQGKVVLYGAHNGVVQGTSKTAKEYGREHTVDSREVYELIADNKLDVLQELDGYGVLTWLTPGSDAVNMARLSNRSDFVAVTVDVGGVVWASTETILEEALKVAGIGRADTLKLDTVGMVYQLDASGASETKETGLRLAKPKPYKGTNVYHETGGEWWDRITHTGMSVYSGKGNGYFAHDDRAERAARYENWKRSRAEREQAASSNFPSVGNRRADGTFAPFKASDGTMWIHTGKHWQKEPKPPVSDLSSAQSQSDDREALYQSQVGLTPYCAHYTSLFAYCSDCGTGRWHAGKRIDYQKLPIDQDEPASLGEPTHDTQPHISIAESAGTWPMVKVENDAPVADLRFSDGKLPDWDTMTDAEIDSITDDEWDLISDAYIGERMHR